MTDERTIKPLMGERFDCVVIGAGHGGCEAALAAARMGWTPWAGRWAWPPTTP